MGHTETLNPKPLEQQQHFVGGLDPGDTGASALEARPALES